MTLEALFNDKSIKAKGKVSTIGAWLLSGALPPDELLSFADQQKAKDKATCIESLEYATKQRPDLADEQVFAYVTQALNEEEPRIKWESAKVIGNIAALFPAQLENPIKNLLPNAENSGTVVRWATAYALAEILKLKTGANKKLLPVIEALCAKEEDRGVQKKYLDALKKLKK